MLERVRALHISKRKILLVMCVSVAMVIVLSLWLLITPPLVPSEVKYAGEKASAATEELEKKFSEIKDAAAEIKGAINDLSETVKSIASTTSKEEL